MKSSDLRIGNRVFCKGELILVTMIGISGIQSSENGRVLNAKFNTPDLEPIPLTEEWLIKFGFDKQRDGSHQRNDFSIFLDKRFRTNLYLQDNERNSFKWFGYECKVVHVHQLQNLFYALTGEELKTKE